MSKSEKIIAVLYTADELRKAIDPIPGFGFVDKTFPPGLVGIEMGGIDIPADTYEFLLNIWQIYQASGLR